MENRPAGRLATEAPREGGRPLQCQRWPLGGACSRRVGTRRSLAGPHPWKWVEGLLSRLGGKSVVCAHSLLRIHVKTQKSDCVKAAFTFKNQCCYCFLGLYFHFRKRCLLCNTSYPPYKLSAFVVSQVFNLDLLVFTSLKSENVEASGKISDT